MTLILKEKQTNQKPNIIETNFNHFVIDSISNSTQKAGKRI